MNIVIKKEDIDWWPFLTPTTLKTSYQKNFTLRLFIPSFSLKYVPISICIYKTIGPFFLFNSLILSHFIAITSAFITRTPVWLLHTEFSHSALLFCIINQKALIYVLQLCAPLLIYLNLSRIVSLVSSSLWLLKASTRKICSIYFASVGDPSLFILLLYRIEIFLLLFIWFKKKTISLLCHFINELFQGSLSQRLIIFMLPLLFFSISIEVYSPQIECSMPFCFLSLS